MGDYSYNELMKMQNDAIKRVEDMQRRARESAGLPERRSLPQQERLGVDEPRRMRMPSGYLKNQNSPSYEEGENNPQTEDIKRETKKETTEKKQRFSENAGEKKPPASFISGILEELQIDPDKALLLSLLVLLSEEGADEALLTGLMYMLT